MFFVYYPMLFVHPTPYHSQDCIHDPNPGIQSLGLTCITTLCRADVLDCYLALRVLAPLFPTMPTHPLVARAWVALLGCGGMDAAAYPEEAAVVLRMLWAATRHTDGGVRAGAWQGVGGFPHEAVDAVLMFGGGQHDGQHDIGGEPSTDQGVDYAEHEHPGVVLVNALVNERDPHVCKCAAQVLGARISYETATVQYVWVGLWLRMRVGVWVCGCGCANACVIKVPRRRVVATANQHTTTHVDTQGSSSTSSTHATTQQTWWWW